MSFDGEAGRKTDRNTKESKSQNKNKKITESQCERRRGRSGGDTREEAMWAIWTWLLCFFFILVLLCLVGFQLVCLLDLEFDYINPYDTAVRINNVILPEFITQGVLCFVFLITGHWLMFIMSLPYLYYDVRLYLQGEHLVDVTEIYNQLNKEKNKRYFKIAYQIILFVFSLFWLIFSLGDEFD